MKLQIKETYKFSLTVRKVVISLLEIVIAGLIALQTQRPEYLLLVPIIEGIRNIIKHGISKV